VAAVVPIGSNVIGAAAPAARRYPRWKDALGCAVAGLWPIVVTMVVLRNPARYNPFAAFSGLRAPGARLGSLPTTTPGVYSTQYTLGLHSASLLVHGHLPWWNPFAGLGAPLIGELQSAALFPLTPLLLVRDGALVFHLALAAIAGVATYWLLREFRCSPLVSAIGGMLYATNGTFAWLAGAAANPVCFLPVMVLGIERARHAARDQRGGGWRWLAVGAALALLSGFIETAALGLILVAVLAVQRGWNLPRDAAIAFARKAVAGLAAGVAIAAPVLVAFNSYLSSGYVAEHAGRAANRVLPGAYLSMSVAPYLFGRIGANAFPEIHTLWSGVGGYAGFALLALAVASLFGRRDRGLRIVLAAWIGLCLADSVGLPGLRQLLAALPVVQHIVLARYLPSTWELALVLLAAFALRDLATASRFQAVVSLTTGVLASALVLLLGMSLAPTAVDASRSITSSSMHQAELLVLAVAAGLLLATLLPLRYRGVGVGAVAVVEAAILFAIPLASWPTDVTVDQGAIHFLATEVGTTRFFSLGPPLPNFGTQFGVRQLDVVGLPVPKTLVPIVRALDPHASVAQFTGVRRPIPGAPTAAQELLRHLALYEQLGVAYVVAPTSDQLLQGHPGATLAYSDDSLQIWKLAAAVPLVRAPGCGLRATGPDAYVTTCPRPSALLRAELDFPGWAATVNGVSVPVVAHGPFQSVALAQGRSVVVLSFLPPDVPIATLASLVALLSLCVPWGAVAAWRRRRRPRFAGWSELEGMGTSLPRRPAEDAVEPATGAVPAVVGADDEPSTSSVPAVTGAIQVALGGPDADGPPTSAVALDTAARPPVVDPPTIAVPLDRDAPPDAGRGA
jgi:hypothetical protein